MRYEFTTYDLMRYLYNEVSYLEKMALEQALKTNALLREEFETLSEAHALLQATEAEALLPEPSVLQSILSYSQSSHLIDGAY